MMSRKKKNKSEKVKRPSFSPDEKDRPWLRLLLDGYLIVDKGVSTSIMSEIRRGRTLACQKGCAACCITHKDIPLYPLEIVGISWYVTEKTKGHVRNTLRKQLSEFSKDAPCPFLIDGECSIHAVRPMACRQFNVFDRPCAHGEDPFHSRRTDVMDPVKKHVDQAFYIMLPYYGVESEQERIKIIETGAFHRMAKELHACRWKELAEKMERHNRKKNSKTQAPNNK